MVFTYAAGIGLAQWDRHNSVLETHSAATDLDLISLLKAIPDARMRRGVRIPAWYLLLVTVLEILGHCQSLRDLERYSFGEGFAYATATTAC